MFSLCSALSWAVYNRNLGNHLTWLVNLPMDGFDWPFSKFLGAHSFTAIVCKQFALSWRVHPVAWSPTNGAVVRLLRATRTYLRLRGRWTLAEQNLRPTSYRMCVLEANLLVQQHCYPNPSSIKEMFFWRREAMEREMSNMELATHMHWSLI